MGLLAARQAEMAEAVVSWSRLRSRIAMIDSLTLAQEVSQLSDRDLARAASTGCIGVTSSARQLGSGFCLARRRSPGQGRSQQACEVAGLHQGSRRSAQYCAQLAVGIERRFPPAHFAEPKAAR